MVIDLPIYTWLLVVVAFGSAVTFIFKTWGSGKKWFGETTLEEVDFENLSEDSSFKQEFNELNRKLDELRNSQNEIKFLRLELLEMRIERAIDHDLGKDYVKKLHSKYKKMNGNGYIDWRVGEYLDKDKKTTICNYFNEMNHHNKYNGE